MLRILSLLRRPFVLDLRALALLRAAVAAVLLLDIGIRATDLEAHYSNLGVLPLGALYEHGWNQYSFSLHNSSGLWQVQAILFLIAAGLAVALLVGYHTRLVTALSWILLVSVQNRNPLISQGGDDLLRMLLFWGFFLPWGRVYSVDSKKQPKPEQLTYFSAATIAYIVQLALVYWCTALLKSSPEWSQEGTALYYALSLDQVLMPGGRLLYPHPDLMRWLTFATYYMEMLLPFVLFIPFRVTFWRLLFVIVMLGFHLGISLTLFVGLFFIINIASIMGLLPPTTMAWLERHIVPRAQRLGSQVEGRLQPWRPRLTAWQQAVGLRVEASWKPPTGIQGLLRSMRDGLVVGLLAYVCWWNLDTIAEPRWTMREPLRWLGHLVRIDQHWGMFAPSVFKDDGWYILDGTTTSGQHLDLNRDGAVVTYEKPASVVSLFKNDRWRKYSENYLFVDNAYMRPYYCNYLLRIWHETPGHAPLRQLDVIYMKEVSRPNYQPVQPVREVLCSCAP
ncbi:HTTM domain-containing protein [Hymenobacter mucosus]|uniref:Vitamin K-dependent gamma-carboxylase n=1 Tax=Hymenobacter mucosus TaxID=1411120 RepID=A0A238VY14_9BACT|nr:HTTM domain-containing protein [Hymenobacter mucosus]SNR39024.1 Vitamin K-dependent gamma-carboxylase [Hymenobacter mucosus]